MDWNENYLFFVLAMFHVQEKQILQISSPDF